MSDLRIIISPNQTIPLADVEKVYQKCKWGWPGDDLAAKALAGSFLQVIAYRGAEPVGFARAISDGVAYALIVDTMVVPSEQNAGIGTALMNALLASLAERKVAVVKLISSKEGKSFYEKLGFSARNSDEPGMMLLLRK